MAHGIELYNQNGAVITKGKNEEMFYWGQQTLDIKGAEYSGSLVYHPIMGIPDDVPFLAFIAYNSMPSSESYSFYSRLIKGDPNNSNSGSDLRLYRYQYQNWPSYSVTVYIFVPSIYIPDLVDYGVRIFNNGKKVWSTDRPMLKLAGFRRQDTYDAPLIAGSTPNRPAMTEGFGPISGNDRRYSATFNGSELRRQWTDKVPSMVHSAYDSNVSLLRSMIDRDYYDQFTSLGYW